MADDDTFTYDGSGGITQCISGFSRNAIENIMGRMTDALAEGVITEEAEDAVKWHFEEFVRWCRHFNGKSQTLEQQLADARRDLEAAKRSLGEFAERDCTYGDNCPHPWGTLRHGVCDGCRARAALAALAVPK